jgi:hypothetical protein
MESICNKGEITYPYYVSVPINISSSENHDSCWMRCDASYPPEYYNDTDFLLSESQTTLAGILATVACIPGAILNFLIILAIIRSPDLRKEYLAPSVASITVTDFLFSVYVLAASSRHNINREYHYPEGCNFFGIMSWGLWMVSAFNLIGIAGLRCFAINFPRRTKNKSFQYCCTIIPVLAWVTTLVFFLPSLTQQYGRFGLQCRVFFCVLLNVDAEGNPVNPDPMAIYFMSILFSGIVLIILNVLGYVQVRKKSRQLFGQIKDTSIEEATKVLRNEKKLQKMVGFITASFVLVYVPLILALVVFPSAGIDYPIIGIMSFSFAWLLVVIDPLIYIYSSEKYRKGIRLVLNPLLSKINKFNQNPDDTSKHRPETQVTTISQSRT